MQSSKVLAGSRGRWQPAEEDCLAPEAAATVLDKMVADYVWISEWVSLTRKAAIEARMKVDGTDVPNGVDDRRRAAELAFC